MTPALTVAGAAPDRIGSLEMDSLRRRYRAGSLDPLAVVEAVLERIAARGADPTWISLVDPDDVRAAARALEVSRIDSLPLYGVPFALKDNIDVAGAETTVACPAFAYVAEESAALVARLLDAGAILLGKTNLDQFATGLNGTRSPYGIPESVFGEGLISGGSSSGSAVAVAAGLVSFAIGTDTAGSGRVPAALNNVVGTKPSIGLVSTVGVVPACRSLDCPSVFALTVADSTEVLAAIAGADSSDAMSRSLPAVDPVVVTPSLDGARFAVPSEISGWGERGERDVWEQLCARLQAAGAVLVPLDLADFAEAGAQLYGGAWIAERYQVMGELLAKDPDAVLPVLRTLMEPAAAVTGAETFAAVTTMTHRRALARAALAEVDALLTPTTTTTFTVAEVLADPLGTNHRLGEFTTFTNLLDLCAVAVPAGISAAGVPFGVTLHAAAGRDAEVARWASALEAQVLSTPGGPDLAPVGFDLAVVGAHLEGMPLHGELLDRGATLVTRTTTSPDYRLHALLGTTPPKPGLERVSSGGACIEVEVYRLPPDQVGSFLATVHSPLGIGELTLLDGSAVHGFICEPAGFVGSRDVTSYGGWRGYVAGIQRHTQG
jgi:allophanate hydrolase